MQRDIQTLPRFLSAFILYIAPKFHKVPGKIMSLAHTALSYLEAS